MASDHIIFSTRGYYSQWSTCSFLFIFSNWEYNHLYLHNGARLLTSSISSRSMMPAVKYVLFEWYRAYGGRGYWPCKISSYLLHFSTGRYSYSFVLDLFSIILCQKESMNVLMFLSVFITDSPLILGTNNRFTDELFVYSQTLCWCIRCNMWIGMPLCCQMQFLAFLFLVAVQKSYVLNSIMLHI